MKKQEILKEGFEDKGDYLERKINEVQIRLSPNGEDLWILKLTDEKDPQKLGKTIIGEMEAGEHFKELGDISMLKEIINRIKCVNKG